MLKELIEVNEVKEIIPTEKDLVFEVGLLADKLDDISTTLNNIDTALEKINKTLKLIAAVK